MDSLPARGTLARALAFVLAGLLLVVLDIRVNTFDFLPDALGWLLVAGALHGCRGVHDDGTYVRRISGAWLLAGAAVLLSFVTVRGVLAVPATVVTLAPPVLAAAAFARLAAVVGDDGLRRSWETSAVAIVSSLVAAFVAAWLDVDAVTIPVVVLVFVAAAHFAVSAMRTRRACRGAASGVPVRGGAAVFVAVATALVVGSGGAYAWGQNFWRPVDPYRAQAVRAGMLDWPIRGNRVRDRGWMHDHLYCCQGFDAARVLYAGQTPYGALTLVEEQPPSTRTGKTLSILGYGGGTMSHDNNIPANAEQVSAVVAMDNDENPRHPVYLLLVVGRPGTTRVRWRQPPYPQDAWRDVPLSHGAGWVQIESGTGLDPAQVEIAVERDGRTVYEGPVTTTDAAGSFPQQAVAAWHAP
jgi:hypothetical protein